VRSAGQRPPDPIPAPAVIPGNAAAWLSARTGTHVVQVLISEYTEQPDEHRKHKLRASVRIVHGTACTCSS
jgi:hypothetical protein